MEETISDELKAWKQREESFERGLVQLDAAGCWAPDGHEKWTIAETIKHLRWTIKIPQSELSWRSEIDQGDVSRIEGGRDALLSTFVRLVEAMECELVVRIRPKRPMADMRKENWRRRV